MHVDFWSGALWMTGFALNLILVVALVIKKRYLALPWFSFLIAQDALQTIVLLTVQRFPRANFELYWAFEIVDALLRVMVIWEIARILIQQHLGLRLYDEIRNGWAVFLLLSAIGISFLTFSSTSPYLTVRIALRIEQISTIGLGCLLWMVLWLTIFFKVKVRVHAQAIVYGLSLYLFGKFIVQAMVMLIGTTIWARAEVWTKPLYLVSLLLWIGCLGREEPERSLSDDMYKRVRLGVAGINPPIPRSIAEEDSRRHAGLTFVLDSSEPPAKLAEASGYRVR